LTCRIKIPFAKDRSYERSAEEFLDTAISDFLVRGRRPLISVLLCLSRPKA
jgi:hypothetical protein